MADLREQLQRWLQTLSPREALTVTQCCERYRVLSSDESEESGPYRAENAPFQIKPQNAFCEEGCDQVTVMGSHQWGKTTIILNVLFYYALHEAAPCMVVTPDKIRAKEFSQERLQPMIAASPRLSDMFRGDGTESKEGTFLYSYPGGRVNITGAISPTGLRSWPARIVLNDEVDGYPASAGGQGPPTELSARRTERFRNRVIGKFSTPLNEGTSEIYASFLAGDQNYWMVPCHGCGLEQRLVWAQVKWSNGDPSTARYECEGCGLQWSELERHRNVKHGDYVPHAPYHGHHSYHVSSFYLPWVPLSRIVESFRTAHHEKDPQKRREAIRTWTNYYEGEVFKEADAQMDAGELYRRREVYAAQVPAPVLVLVGSCDTQDTWLDWSVTGRAADESSFGVAAGRIVGDPSNTGDTGPWASLVQQMDRTYSHELGLEMRVAAYGVDVQGHHEAAVHKFVRGQLRLGRTVLALRGVGGKHSSTAPILGRANTKNRWGVPVHPYGSVMAKKQVFAELSQPPGPGCVHFPRAEVLAGESDETAGYDMEWFRQLAAEKRVVKYHHGHPTVTFERVRTRNEAIDLLGMQLAVLLNGEPNYPLLQRQMDTRVELLRAAVDETPPAALSASETTAQNFVKQTREPQGRTRGRRGGSWATRY